MSEELPPDLPKDDSSLDPIIKTFDDKQRSTFKLDPTPEEMLKWTLEWRAKIEKEIAEYQAMRDNVYEEYVSIKKRMDSWLSKRTKKIKRFDTAIAGRKKVLINIDRSLREKKINTPPSDQHLTPTI